MLNQIFWIVSIALLSLFILNLIIVLRYTFGAKKVIQREKKSHQLVREVKEIGAQISSLFENR